MLWDILCRVVDNFGDVGVAWRLANDLMQRGERVRLRIDDAAALAWMAPGATLAVLPFDASIVPGDVVVETFGCGLPAGFFDRVPLDAAPPLWIDVEYLSAEAYVERSHALPSPQGAGPGAGRVRWFYFPGFTEATGGLIREPDLETRQRGFDRAAWLRDRGLVPRPGERVVSCFCYRQPALAALLDALEPTPTLLLATAGAAAEQVAAQLGARGAGSGARADSGRRLRAITLPPLSQSDYDHLLWASDLNLVRGEDSFVRAQWAGRPFVWQLYPQDDGAHLVKLEAFLERFDPPEPVARLWRHWNGGAAPATLGLPSEAPWLAHAESWRRRLLALPPLGAGLIGFARARR